MKNVYQMTNINSSVTQRCKTATWTYNNLSLCGNGQREIFKLWMPFPIRKNTLMIINCLASYRSVKKIENFSPWSPCKELSVFMLK